MQSVLTNKQTRTFRRDFMEGGDPVTLIAEVRYDDECGNGHNSFAITGERYEKHRQHGEPTVKHDMHRGPGHTLWLNSCGCLHDDIAAHFPELAPLIKWHLTSSDGPLHYVANTMYHADEHGPTMAWVRFDDPENGIKANVVTYCAIEKAIDMCLQPSKTFNYVSLAGYRYEPDEKTAKKADIEAARSCAMWPDATIEQLRDKAALEARLPALLAEFRAAVESLGFTY